MLDSTKRESGCTFKVGFDPGMAVAGGSDGWIDESKIDERRDSDPKPLFEDRVQLERTESGAERWILLESKIATPEAEARMKALSIVSSHLATVKAKRKFGRVHLQRSEIVGSHQVRTLLRLAASFASSPTSSVLFFPLPFTVRSYGGKATQTLRVR